MEQSEFLFIQYRPMIEKAVWKEVNRFGASIEYEDIQSQAYLLFMEAVNRYDPDEGSFSNFLHSELRRLKDYCYYQVRRTNNRISLEHARIPRSQYSYDTFIKAYELAESIIQLSKDSREIINFIISRVWEIPGDFRIRPSLRSVSRWYVYGKGWNRGRVKKAWKEIHKWWIRENAA